LIVRDLILELQKLNQEQEIRFESYEFGGDFKISKIYVQEYNGQIYYCICD